MDFFCGFAEAADRALGVEIGTGSRNIIKRSKILTKGENGTERFGGGVEVGEVLDDGHDVDLLRRGRRRGRRGLRI